METSQSQDYDQDVALFVKAASRRLKQYAAEQTVGKEALPRDEGSILLGPGGSDEGTPTTDEERALTVKVNHESAEQNEWTALSEKSLNTPKQYEEIQLPRDTFSFLVAAKPLTVPFWTAIFVAMLKNAAYGLMLYDILQSTLRIPVLVPVEVFVSQILAYGLMVLTQQDLLSTLNLTYHGYCPTIREVFPEGGKWWQWALSIGLASIDAIVGLATTFLLIATSDTALTVFLNFAAITFVASFDESFFILSHQSLLGKRNAVVAGAVADRVFCRPLHRIRSWTLQMVVLFVLAVAAMATGTAIYSQQSTGYYAVETIFAQFDDEVRPDLAAHSGFYVLDSSAVRTGREGFVYREERDGGGMIGYCRSRAVWTFSRDTLSPCDNPLAESTRVASFDVKRAFTSVTSWAAYVSDASQTIPLKNSYIDAGCLSNSDCGGESKGTCKDNRCICVEGWSGVNCLYKEDMICSEIKLDERFGQRFASQRPITSSFELVPAKYSYQRPIYLNNSTQDFIFFSGYRWAVTKLNQAFSDLDSESALTRVTSLDFHSGEIVFIDLLSDPVKFRSVTDMESSPVAFDWYGIDGLSTSLQTVEGLSPLGSPSRFLCTICNDSENKCFFEGTCGPDFRCSCKHGATGSLCQKAPLGNGECNNFFNEELFGFDGGDCCAPTCSSSLDNDCGSVSRGNINHLSVGYNTCRDPDVVGQCDPDKPCFLSSKELSALAQTGTTPYLSSNGNLAVLVEPRLDQIHTVEFSHGSWVHRGDSLPGTPSFVSLCTPPASLSGKHDSSKVPIFLATYSQGMTKVHKWGVDDTSWSEIQGVPSNIGEGLVDFGCNAGNGDVISLVHKKRNSENAHDQIQFNWNTWISGEMRWKFAVSELGSHASISGNGNVFVVYSSSLRRIRVYPHPSYFLINQIEAYVDTNGDVMSIKMNYEGTILTVVSNGPAQLYQYEITAVSVNLLHHVMLQIADIASVRFSPEGSVVAFGMSGSSRHLSTANNVVVYKISPNGDLDLLTSLFLKAPFDLSISDESKRMAFVERGESDVEEVQLLSLQRLCSENEVLIRVTSALGRSVEDEWSVATEAWHSLSDQRVLKKHVLQSTVYGGSAFEAGVTVYESCLPVSDFQCSRFSYFPLSSSNDFEPGHGTALFSVANGTTVTEVSIELPYDLPDPIFTQLLGDGDSCDQIPAPACKPGQTLFSLVLSGTSYGYGGNPYVHYPSWSLLQDDTSVVASKDYGNSPGGPSILEQLCLPSNSCYALQLVEEERSTDCIACMQYSRGNYTAWWGQRQVMQKPFDGNIAPIIFGENGSCSGGVLQHYFFVGEGYCVDEKGSGYDFFVLDVHPNNEASCADQCRKRSIVSDLVGFVGFVYDGSCKCLLSNGEMFHHDSSSFAKTSDTSHIGYGPIARTDGSDSGRCFSTKSSTLGLSPFDSMYKSMGQGLCRDKTGQEYDFFGCLYCAEDAISCGQLCYFDYGTEPAFRGFWFGDGRCSCLFDNARIVDPMLPTFAIGSQQFYHDGTGAVAASSNDGNNFVCFASIGADGPTPRPTPAPSNSPTRLNVKSLYHYVGKGDCVDNQGESYDYFEAQLDFEECGLKCDEIYGNAVAFVGFSWIDEIDGCYCRFDNERPKPDPELELPFMQSFLLRTGTGSVAGHDSDVSYVCYATKKRERGYPSESQSFLPTPSPTQPIEGVKASDFLFVGPGWCLDSDGRHFESLYSCDYTGGTDGCAVSCHEAFGNEPSFVGFEIGDCCYCLFDKSQTSGSLNATYPFTKAHHFGDAGGTGAVFGSDSNADGACFATEETWHSWRLWSIPSLLEDPGKWDIATIVGYTTSDCSPGTEVQSPYVRVTSSGYYINDRDTWTYAPEQVLDGDPETLWGGRSDASGDFWIAVSFPSTNVNVQCMFILHKDSEVNQFNVQESPLGSTDWHHVKLVRGLQTSSATISFEIDAAFAALFSFVGEGNCIDDSSSLYDYVRLEGLDDIQCGILCHNTYGNDAAFVGFSHDGFWCQCLFSNDREYGPQVSLPFTSASFIWSGVGTIAGHNSDSVFLCYRLSAGYPTISPSLAAPTSPSATASPTEVLIPYACPNGVPNILIEIRTDGYPLENSWEIADETGAVIETGGDYETANILYNHTLCLEPGKYLFTFKDSFGDGLFDPAFYRLTVEGTEVKYGSSGSFKGSDTSAFFIGDDQEPSCFRTEAALTSTFTGNKWAYGAVFVVQALQSLAITSLAIKTDLTGDVPVIVLARDGLFSTDEKGLKVGWSIVSIQSVQGRGSRNPTLLDCFDEPLVVNANQTLSFYVSILKTEGSPLAYSDGTEAGAVFSENSDLILFEGIGVSKYPFSQIYSNRVFNGEIHYTKFADLYQALGEGRCQDDQDRFFDSVSSCEDDISEEDCGWLCFEAFGLELSFVGFEHGSNCCRCLFRSDRLSRPMEVSPFGQLITSDPIGASGRPSRSDGDLEATCFLFYGPETEAPSRVPSGAPTFTSSPSQSPSLSMAPSLSFDSIFTFIGEGFCQDGDTYYGYVYNSCYDAGGTPNANDCGRMSYNVYGSEPSFLGFSWDSSDFCCYAWFDASRTEDPQILFPFVGDELDSFDGTGKISSTDGSENLVCFAITPSTESPSKAPSVVPTSSLNPTNSLAPSTYFDSLFDFVGLGWCQDEVNAFYGSIYFCGSAAVTDAFECGLLSQDLYGNEASFLGFNWDGSCCYALMDANREQDPSILAPFNADDLADYSGNGLVTKGNGSESLVCYSAKAAGTNNAP